MLENGFEIRGNKIKFNIAEMGEDLVVLISGGDKPHIGAVSIGIPCPSLKNPEERSSTVSNYSFIRHKDDVLSNRCAEYLAKRLDKKIVVICGIHFNESSPKMIEEIIKKSERIYKKIVNSLTIKH